MLLSRASSHLGAITKRKALLDRALLQSMRLRQTSGTKLYPTNLMSIAVTRPDADVLLLYAYARAARCCGQQRWYYRTGLTFALWQSTKRNSKARHDLIARSAKLQSGNSPAAFVRSAAVAD